MVLPSPESSRGTADAWPDRANPYMIRGCQSLILAPQTQPGRLRKRRTVLNRRPTAAGHRSVRARSADPRGRSRPAMGIGSAMGESATFERRRALLVVAVTARDHAKWDL